MQVSLDRHNEFRSKPQDWPQVQPCEIVFCFTTTFLEPDWETSSTTPSISALLCSWAYVSCQYKAHVHFPTWQQKHAEHRTLFENGDTSHSRAFRLWVWLYTHAKLIAWLQTCVNLTCMEKTWCRTPVLRERLFWEVRTLVRWTLVRRRTCVNQKGRETRGETSGWEKKNRASKEAETSDNIQRGWTYLAYVTWQCMSLVMLCHLTSWSRKRHMKNF